MASPHIAGLAAYFLGLYGKQDPVYVSDLIKYYSTKDAISGLGLPNTATTLDIGFNDRPFGKK